MTEQKTLSKADLLDRLRDSGKSAVERLRSIPAADFEAGRYESGWNGRQILAHIASIEWSYPRLIDVAREAVSPKPAEAPEAASSDPPTRTATGGINDYSERQMEKRAQASVDELITEFQTNRATMIAAVEAADEALFSAQLSARPGVSRARSRMS